MSLNTHHHDNQTLIPWCEKSRWMLRIQNGGFPSYLQLLILIVITWKQLSCPTCVRVIDLSCSASKDFFKLKINSWVPLCPSPGSQNSWIPGPPVLHDLATQWVTHQQSPSWTTGTTANQPTNLNKIFLPNKLPPPSALTLFNSSLSFSTSDWATIRSFWTKLDGKVHYWIAIFMSTLVLCCSASKFAKFDRKLFTSCSSWSLDEI